MLMPFTWVISHGVSASVRADALHVGHQSRRQCEYLQPLSWLGHCLPRLHRAGGGVEGGGGGVRF